MHRSYVPLAIAALAPVAAAQDPAPVTDATAAQEPGMQIELPKIDKLTISGEYRIRYENRLNYDFDKNSTDHNDFFTQRIRLNFDFQFNEQIGAFIQLQDVRNWGQEMSTTAASAPGFDIHQGYVEVDDFPGIGGSDRIGRQKLSYGNQRLIGALEWLSQARAFDGIRHRWLEKDSYTIDVFGTQTYEDTTTRGTNDDAFFLGAYGTWDIAEDGVIDGYLLYLHGQQSSPAAMPPPPDERRVTVGARWQQQFGALEAEVEYATQGGEASGTDIPFFETYAVHAHLTGKLGGEKKPYLRAELNAASGNDPNSTDNERFNNLFPTAHMHLGMMDLALWENILSGALRAGFSFAEKSKVELAWWYFRSMEETDRFGGPNGPVSSGAAPGSSNEMGNEIDLFFHWDLGTEKVMTALQAGYGLFLPGDGAKDANGGFDDPAHFVYLQGHFRF